MYLAVDIGGTKTLLAVFTDSGELKQELRFETPKDYKNFFETFQNNLKSLGGIDFKAGGIAIPGLVDRKNGIGLRFGNLDWKNVPIQADIEKLINAPVVIENDAKAGALYEANNIINEFKRCLFITIGTGIGISLVVDGIIDTNMGDRGGNAIIVDYRGKQKTWEQIASGKAIVKRYGKKASDIDDPQIWSEIAEDLASGLVNIAAITEPDIIIIGGGVGTQFDKFDDYLKKDLKKYETPLMSMPPIKKAHKPEEAVIYGCYELVKQKYGSHTKAAKA